MKLAVQKRLAASVVKCSPKHVSFDTDRLSDIKEAITRADIKSLIKTGAIKVRKIRGISRSRIRHRIMQKKKGRRAGFGSRKGTPYSRLPKKSRWIRKIRTQRRMLKMLKEGKELNKRNYRLLYRKAKGGVFRDKHHLQLYIDEHKLREKNENKNIINAI